jgi:methyl-accepting chemotaxis protein
MSKLSARNVSITLAIFCLAGLAFSFYTLFQSEATDVPNRFYLLLGVSTAVGAVALVIALSDYREVVVFRDRTAEEAEQANAHQTDDKKTISQDQLLKAIGTAKTRQEMLRAGLQELCKPLEAGQGALYVIEEQDQKRVARLTEGYALAVSNTQDVAFTMGEGLIGQAAASGKSLYLDELPEGYIKILSGLGSASPRYLFISPGKSGNEVTLVAEIATFTPWPPAQRAFIEEGTRVLAEKFSKL